MRSDNADSHDVSKATEVLNESEQMIPDTKKRLEVALKDLREYMVCLYYRIRDRV